jgi:hypothetical protein
MLYSILASTARSLKDWRGASWLVFAVVGAVKQLGWLEATWVPPSWVWWTGAIVVLFMNNVRLTDQARQQQNVKPDLGAADAYKSILARSKRAKELVRRQNELLNLPVRYESEFTEAGVIEERLKRRLREEIHDALRQGHVKAWGTPRDGSPEKEIEATEWATFGIQFDDDELDRFPAPLGGPPPIAAWQRKPDPKGRILCYANVRFSRVNLYREFPLATWPRRIDWVQLRKPPISD